MSILITAANSAQAYQLKTMLQTDALILLGDYHDIPEVLVKAGKMIKTPNPESQSFVHEMLALCLDNSIAELYALRRSELLPLAEARQLFSEFDIKLFIPDKEMIENNMTHPVIDGRIVVVENGEIIKGDTLNNVFNLHPFGESWKGDGVFKVNPHDYMIFTAD